MKKTLTPSILVPLIAWGVFIFPHSLDENVNHGDEVVQDDAEEKNPPSYLLSSRNISQGGVLGVAVLGVQEPVEVLWDGEEVPVLKTQNGYAGVVGVSLDEPRGEVVLSLKFSREEEVIQETVFIQEKNYGSSRLSLPQSAQDAGETPDTLVKNISSNDNAKIGEAIIDSPEEAYFSEPFVIPTLEWVDVGGFGVVRKSESSAIRHLGTDLEGEMGDSVYAINVGKVVLADTLTNYGNSIIIDHGQGIWSLYLHLSEMDTSEGEIVERGQKIGEIGSTGLYSFSPHLHFSVRIRGESVDPKAFIDAMNAVLQW